MLELENALKAFAASQIDYAGLLRALGGTLRADPGAIPVAVQLLDRALADGLIPQPIHADFMRPRSSAPNRPQTTRMAVTRQ